MLDRRVLIAGIGTILFPIPLRSQEKPRLFVLGARISGQVLDYHHVYVGKSLEGWLVCNGAEADRTTYRKLFAELGIRAGPGDGLTTFNLPTFAFELKNGQPARGTAICPSWQFGAPPASILPFNIDNAG